MVASFPPVTDPETKKFIEIQFARFVSIARLDMSKCIITPDRNATQELTLRVPNEETNIRIVSFHDHIINNNVCPNKVSFNGKGGFSPVGLIALGRHYRRYVHLHVSKKVSKSKFMSAKNYVDIKRAFISYFRFSSEDSYMKRFYSGVFEILTDPSTDRIPSSCFKDLSRMKIDSPASAMLFLGMTPVSLSLHKMQTVFRCRVTSYKKKVRDKEYTNLKFSPASEKKEEGSDYRSDIKALTALLTLNGNESISDWKSLCDRSERDNDFISRLKENRRISDDISLLYQMKMADKKLKGADQQKNIRRFNSLRGSFYTYLHSLYANKSGGNVPTLVDIHKNYVGLSCSMLNVSTELTRKKPSGIPNRRTKALEEEGDGTFSDTEIAVVERSPVTELFT